ncbi:uncharacterized protein LOC107464219 isoform X1 [Arachis duranensis]|uniref:Uncharacterized protein LOC107464219 isoform X1 n=1 Tax=Arachis duranensis TaxID=130453 RepID=A0A6P4C014_ARADU|nr:uncharacterized protein LOC107464219 isoform X1 [Arachis duranensis]XP_025617946.1 uncharacterized protein LOC112710066 isoform X1 [Arachis hypogaea]QHO33417.1 Transmembrane protein, putative [Arachis hypogaea]
MNSEPIAPSKLTYQNPKFSLQWFCRSGAAVRAVGASASSLVIRHPPSPCPRSPWILSPLCRHSPLCCHSLSSRRTLSMSPSKVHCSWTRHFWLYFDACSTYNLREDDKCWLFPVILFLFKSIQARFVNWHIANREIQDFSLFCPDPDAFWDHEPGL